MPIEEFIIYTCCVVDDYFQKIISHQGCLRKRGEKPRLSDVEVITMEVVGEYLGQCNDKAIWRYFRLYRHGIPLFLKFLDKPIKNKRSMPLQPFSLKTCTLRNFI